MSTDCSITIDHPNDVYNAGDILNGNVTLRTQKSKSIRGISITITGYAKIRWSQNTGGKNSTTFTAHEKYLNSVTYVVGSAEGNTFDFEPGIYNYTFNCQLPRELPNSMKEKYGEIKYRVIVTINRRLRFDNVFKRRFYVNHISDLNVQPSNKLPRRSNIEKEISFLYGCCFCCTSKIRAELNIPCGGYIPGQTVNYQLNIYNDSNINLSGGRIKFKKCCTFTSTDPYVREREVLHDIMIQPLEQTSSKSSREIKGSFPIPYIMPTTRTNNVRVDYKLKVKIPLRCYIFRKFCIEIPVTIGTIPISDVVTTYTNSNNISSDTVPVSNFYKSSIQPNNENYNMNAHNTSYYSENSVNPQDVTIIKSTGGVLNKESSVTYGWT